MNAAASLQIRLARSDDTANLYSLRINPELKRHLSVPPARVDAQAAFFDRYMVLGCAPYKRIWSLLTSWRRLFAKFGRNLAEKSYPQRRFGGVELDRDRRVVSVDGKPRIPESNAAATGLYFYDNSVVNVAKESLIYSLCKT